MNNDWLDIAILEDYLDGKLDPKTMNRVEREALEDPFVAEALAGLSASPKRSLASISLLQKQLRERVAVHQATKKDSIITWQRLSIAAAAAVLFITVGIVFWMKQVNYQQMAAKQPKKVEVIIAARKQAKDSPAISEEAAADKTPATGKNKNAAVINPVITGVKTNAYASNAKAKVREPINIQASRRQSITYAAAAIAPITDKMMIRGKVTEGSTGQPLQNVMVSIEGTNLVTNTNKDGEFAINADTSLKEPVVIASYIGYDDVEILAKVNQAVAISLNESHIAMNETAVHGYQKKSDPASTEQLSLGKVAGLNSIRPNPAGGWPKFNEYLVKENRFSKEAKIGKSVELSFTIKNGRPKNITITKGLADKYNNEAIRLIKKGPKWEQSKTDSPNVSILIEF